MKLETPEFSSYTLEKAKRIRFIEMVNSFDDVKIQVVMDKSNKLIIYAIPKGENSINESSRPYNAS